MADVSINDWVAVIEVDDFSPLSEYDAGFAEKLTAAIVDVSDHDEVKAVVLRARNDHFAPHREPVGQAARDVTTTWHQAFAASSAVYQALTFSKKVVITEVRGECAGAGSNLVLCSDLTVADDSATFGSPFTDHPESNFVLAALTMRLNRAKAWLVRDSVIQAERALEIGLVNELVPGSRLAEASLELARSVTGMPLDGVTMSKMLQQAVYDAHGVGREFDLGDHYAIHRWALGWGDQEGPA